MATLQEQAARAWAPRRGVTVYSPTRPILRPQGTTANAGTAQRILQGRQPPNWQPQTTQFNVGQTTPLPSYTPPEQPGGGRTMLDDILDQYGTGLPPEQEQEPGGWRGVLGTVANSVPGKAIFAALDVLDRPRRAIAATLAEGLDALGLNAESRSDGDASWSDWWNQFNDPTFGFGDIVAATGNKWLDRGIGLAGDLAMDPLNYLTGSGVIAGTGARARVHLAARAFGAGVAPEIAARTGRVGMQALSNAERRAINLATDGSERLLDRGYYAKLPFIDARVRIPGTGSIEQAIGGQTARARNAIASTRPLSTMRYWRSERGLQDAIGKILTGRGDISFGVAAALVNYRKGAGIAANRVVGMLSAEWNRLVSEYGHKGLQDMVHEAETAGGTALNRFYDMAADLMEKEGLQRPDFPNYIPHVFTDEAINWLRNTPEGRGFHNQLFKEIDFDDLSPHMMQRKLVGGTEDKPRVYVLNGVRMEFKEGTIREINEQFAKANPNAGFKLLEDDISNISARYSKSMSGSVGEAGGLLYLANQARGLVRYADDDSVLKEIVDAAETRKLNVEAHKTVKNKLSAAKELVAAVKQQRDQGIVALHGPMEAHLRKLVDTMDTLEPQAREELKGLLATQAMLSAQRESLAREPLEYTENAARLQAASNAAFEQLDAEYQELSQRLAHIEPAFKIAEQQWLDAQRAAVEARQSGQAGIKSPPMTDVQKEYRKGVVQLTQLTIDRDAAASINQRVKAALRKEQIIERNLDSDTFAALAADKMGIGKVGLNPPVKYIDPDTGQVQWIDVGTPVNEIPAGVALRRQTPEGVQQARMAEAIDPRRSRGRTPETIYREHNRRRAEAILEHENNFPVLREYQNRIEAQTEVVLSARQDLFNAASLSSRKIKAAQLHLNEVQQIEHTYQSQIMDLVGNPRMSGRQKNLEAKVAEHRAPGGPRERAQNNYTDAQRPMTEARQVYNQAVAELDRLKRAQNAEAAKIRLAPRDIISEQIRGAGLRHITAGREAQQARSRVAGAQQRVADLTAQREQLTAQLPDNPDLRYQIGAIDQSIRQAQAAITQAEADVVARIATVDALKGELDTLRAQRTRMDTGDYFAERLNDISGRDREVNVALRAQEQGRERYAQTIRGRREQALRNERNRVSRDIDAGDRQFDYWRTSYADASGPWRPVHVVERADGTYEVRPLWEGVVGRAEMGGMLELAEKRTWFTEHFIDRTSSELDVLASDILRARDRLSQMTDQTVTVAGGKVTKLQNQINRMVAKHQRLTARLRRYRQFATDKYDMRMLSKGLPLKEGGAYSAEGFRRRAALIDEVKELVAARNRQVVERERINSQLLDTGNQLDVYDDNISRLRLERTEIRKELAETVREQTVGVVPVRAETLYGRRLASVQNSERNALSTARDQAYGYKLTWEPVPTAPVDLARVDVWTPAERTNLNIAYSIQDAWEQTPKEFRTAEFKAQRDAAVKVIRDLTNPDAPRGGVSTANHRLRMIIDNYDEEGLSAALDELQRSRIPFKRPTQRSKLGRALERGSGAGDRSPEGISRRAVRMFKELTDDYEQKFLDRGAISPGTMQYFRHKWIQLQDVNNAFQASVREGGGSSPILLSRRDQLASDLNRFNEIMFTYRAALEEGGAQPSAALAAFIAAERLDKEADTIRTNLTRTLNALGNPELAAEDAALDATRMKLVNKTDKALYDYEELTRTYNEMELGRPLSEDEEKLLRNARARYNRARNELEKLPDTPMASALSDEVAHIAYLAEQYIEGISASFRDLKAARSIIRNQGSPIRRARELDGTIEKATADIARADEEIATMRRLIQEAERSGATTIEYVPWYGVQRFAMTPQEVLDEIANGERIKITQQNEKRLGNKARQQLAEGNEDLITWSRQFTANTEPVTLDLYSARNLVHTNEAALVSRRWNLEYEIAQRAAYQGMANEWINHFNQVIEDQIRPPIIEVLRGELRDLQYEVGRIRGFDELSMTPTGDVIETAGDATEREALRIQMLRDRIELASGQKMTEGELDTWRRKLQLYEDTADNVKRTMGDEASFAAMQAAGDDGRAMFTGLVSGERPVTEYDIQILTDLFGDAEEAELSILWLNTFNQLIDVVKHRRLTEQQMGGMQSYEMAQRYPELAATTSAEYVSEISNLEASYILAQLREVAGDSQLNDRFANLIAESVETGGFGQTTEELEATVARQEARALEERVAAGEAEEAAGPQARGFNLQSMRNGIVTALIESSLKAKDAAMADTTRVLRLLGFDNFIQSQRKLRTTTMTGQQAVARAPIEAETRLSLLGYSISKEIFTDKSKLYDFITDMIHGTDFDHSHALRRNARNLTARLTRIDAMRRALGASLDESAERVTDPDRFLGLLAKWREPNAVQAESGAEVLDRITDFNTNVLPPEMNQIYADRISRLNQDFAEAVMRNDIDEINRIGPQIRELHEANQPNPMANLGPEMPPLYVAGMMPSPTEDAARTVAAEATAVPPTNEAAVRAQAELASAQSDVDNARQALAAAEAQMGGGGPVSVPGPDAPTEARTLDEYMLDDDYQQAPGGKLTRAEVLRRSDELTARRRELPSLKKNRDAAQELEWSTIRTDLANLSERRWREEPGAPGRPGAQVEITEALYEFEKKGTPLPWDVPTGEATNQETLQRLRQEVDQAEARLAEARSTADATHLGPGDNTAGELADIAPPSPDAAARRAELQAQAEAARAAGDENAARFAEQQMGWLDEPEEAAKPAIVDPVEEQGVAAEVVPPDEIPLPPEVRLPDGTPARLPQQIDEQFKEVVEEFGSLMKRYGPYENMPDEVKQRLAALSATARRLVDDRRNLRATDAGARQRVVDEVPELAAYLERIKRIPAAIPPTISSDWEQVLRNGPSVRTFDPLLERRLKPKVKLHSGVNRNEPATAIIGEVFPMERRPRANLLRGNVVIGPNGERIVAAGAVTEASLRAQLEESPGRIVQTARERLISRLNEIKAERRAAEAEGVAMTVDVMQRNVEAIRAANAPMIGPQLPELTPDELAAVARGELDRITPEWRQAFEAEQAAARNLEAARSQRAAEAAQTAEQAAREQRTKQLEALDMDLAKVRTDIEAVTTGVADYEGLRTKINSALSAIPKDMDSKSPIAQDLVDLAASIRDLSTIAPTEAAILAALLDDALLAQRQLDAAQVRSDVLDRHLKSFGNNPKKAMIAGRVMKQVAIDGWEGIATKLLRGEDATLSAAGEAAGLRRDVSVKIASELRARLERVTKLMETPEAWKLVDKYTAFFKTYATGRPGFHVRNALSAIFMNMVDGVRIRDMYAGLSAWRKFTKNPREFWEASTPQMRDAITAVLASGAGGQFAERGIATAGTGASRAYRMVMNNVFTRFNQRAGTMVEGAARMGMALNSVHRRQGLAGMVDRITKYHFNYRELSSMDITARRYIPFWTFMSRNLPLQLEQMWLRPQMYLRYQSLVRNFAEEPHPLTPNYWLMQGAFTMDEDAENNSAPWYLAPDLPHLRVAEPFEAMVGGDWGKALLSDINPLGMAPIEAFAFNKKVYTGQPIEGDYIEPSAVMKPLLPILSLLGGTQRAASGQTVVDDRYAHVARSLLPPLELLERLTTAEGTRAGRQGETWARTFGAPVYKLTPELQQSTARGQRAERREQRRTQAQLARL